METKDNCRIAPRAPLYLPWVRIFNASRKLAFVPVWLCLLLFPVAVKAQDSAGALTVSGGMDVFSRYIWRGIEISESPSLQPGLAVSWKGFILGSWGAYKLTGPGNQETDFYLSKTLGLVTVALWDYWNFNDTSHLDFFNYRKASTPHILEGQLILNGGEKLPLSLLASWFFYGADHPGSVYLELQYLRQTDFADFQAFAGYQVRGTYYAAERGFVNIGGMVRKPIRITHYFDLPVSLSLVFNPQSRSAYLVGGLSILIPGRQEPEKPGMAWNRPVIGNH